MSFINKFNSLSHMDDYYQSIFEVNNSIVFLGNSNETSLSLQQMSQKIIDIVTSSEDSFYVYPFSKTLFRKNIYFHLVHSTYKAFINSLKNHSYIIEHSGSNVIFKKALITQEIYDSYLSQINLDTSDLSNYFSKVSTKISNLEADIEFYKNYILELQTTNDDLNSKLLDAQEQIYNKSISTWY